MQTCICMHIQTGFVYRVVRPRLHDEGPQRQSFKRKRKVLNVLNVKNTVTQKLLKVLLRT